MNSAERIAVTFSRVLRGAGLAVPISSVIGFTDALGVVGIEQRDGVYWAGRGTLVRRQEDIAVFDLAFAAFWERLPTVAPAGFAPSVRRAALAVDSGEDDLADDAAVAEDQPSAALRFSAAEVLRHKDFAAYDPDELRDAQMLMHRLRLAGPPRRSFRHRPSPTGRRHDLRATLRASLRTAGEPVHRRWRSPGERHRRLVLLLDISGSMEPYARAMLRFVHAAVAGRQRVEAFVIGTRLTRITRELTHRDPDVALRDAATRVADWSGGTRLGECLRTFNDEWGVRGMARGSIVVVLSDGWDRGDPAVLGEQMCRLQRVAFNVVWVNPLKFTPGYAPLARGMAAALPYVDHFVEGHSVVAMEELALVIGDAVSRRRHVPAAAEADPGA
jgi:uncharacterized protein